jgi:putative zinc finger/helix-turn-helix YgiT family protein
MRTRADIAPDDGLDKISSHWSCDQFRFLFNARPQVTRPREVRRWARAKSQFARLLEELRMLCRVCDTETTIAPKQRHRYREVGLPDVVLVGIDVSRCPRCGDVRPTIPYPEELHRLVAQALVEKNTRLLGDEVRFLRGILAWSAKDFARHLGVSPETVSRWEAGTIPIGPQADRLLRLLVVQGRLTIDYPLERLAAVNTNRASPARVEVKLGDQEWVRVEGR